MSAVPAPTPLHLIAPKNARSEIGGGAVAMLIATRSDGALVHTSFDRLPSYLDPGDLLVVNTSATLPAALPARLDGRLLHLHLSTPVSDTEWVVELRTEGLRPLRPAPIGARLDLPGGASAVLLRPFASSDRLSVARVSFADSVERYLHRYGAPIRYGHLERPRHLDAYQTVFALEPGSVEMPSAARPFTAALVTRLVSRGVLFAPITLHTGVSSLDRSERPYPERYRVPAATARLVNAVRGWGGRVIAVGTTSVRALESVAGTDGTVEPGEGLTDLIVTTERGLRAVDGLLTGWHEPESSHLDLLEAVAGRDLLRRSYRAARRHGYAWHEFGDTHLIVP